MESGSVSLKRWKHRGRPLLIPDQHEPGVQKGYRMGKPKHQPNSEHHSQSTGGVNFWRINMWAEGSIYK